MASRVLPPPLFRSFRSLCISWKARCENVDKWSHRPLPPLIHILLPSIVPLWYSYIAEKSRYKHQRSLNISASVWWERTILSYHHLTFHSLITSLRSLWLWKSHPCMRSSAVKVAQNKSTGESKMCSRHSQMGTPLLIPCQKVLLQIA